VKPFPARKPVFVDSSGHRHRTVRRLGAVLAIPAGGYVLLLVSSMLGGPQVDTPFIPLPEAAKHQPGPKVTKAPERAAETPEPGESVHTPDTSLRPVAAETTTPSTPEPPTGGPTQTPLAPATSAPTTAAPTSSAPTPSTPTVVPTSSNTPTATPTKTPGHGKPTAPPGHTKTPNKP
jgi:hypothetical protein